MLSIEKSQSFVAARRSVIAQDFPGLNDMQLKAVLATEGPLLVLAGAGSGKTTVLIQRIANIIKYGRAADCDDVPDFVGEREAAFLEAYAANPNADEREAAERLCMLDPAAPWSVIAITFTNKAAGELKERLAAKLGSRAEDVWASTFHSACVRILRRDIDKLGYGRDFTIYDSADSERVMKDIVSDLRLEENLFAPKAVLKFISDAKDKMVFPNEYEAAFGGENGYRAARVALAYKEYQKRLKMSNALDFDDLILLAVQLLLQDSGVREYYQNKFRYVLVDEYQDTNNLQYLFVKTLAGKWHNICVVGDDDQSIYRFRGATVENILLFENRYKNARVVKLEQNYRSTQTILGAANAVIDNNITRKGKSLWTKNDTGERILVYEAADDGDEAHFIARQIHEHVSRGGRFGDAAVLCRMNAQMNRIEDAFKRSGVPYRVVGGTRFFDRLEIKDMLAYLWTIRNTGDDLRLRRIINNPPRKIGDKTVDAVAQLAAETGVTMFEVVSSVREYPALSGAAERLSAFAGLINYLVGFAASNSVADLYDEVIEKTGYVRALEAKEQSEPAARGRIENVLELKSNIIGYETESEEPTLGGFLDEIALFTDIDKYDTAADAAVLMTMHSAKGLEFPLVFLAGLEEGMFPGTRALGFVDELEEERRLCYVGITRARKRLCITYAKRRMIFGRTSFNPPSRFIAELPQEAVEERRSEYSGFTQGYNAPVRSTAKTQPRAVPKAPAIMLNVGERVTHKTFGAGLVVAITQMGGDALLEIAFDDAGTKRLMRNTAASYLIKT